MDCLTLLERARAEGIEVRADAERLIVRGPRSAESLAEELLARKPEVMALLASPRLPCLSCSAVLAPGRRYHCPDCTEAIRRDPPTFKPASACHQCGAVLEAGRWSLCPACFRAGMQGRALGAAIGGAAVHSSTRPTLGHSNTLSILRGEGIA